MTTTDSNNAHPDIEIYLKSVGSEQIEAWLTQRLGPLQPLKHSRKVKQLQVSYDGQPIPILIIENAIKSYSSLLLESDASPWARDIDCAREAFAHFQKEIRCIASGWREGDEPDEWIAIDESGENIIEWRT